MKTHILSVAAWAIVTQCCLAAEAPGVPSKDKGGAVAISEFLSKAPGQWTGKNKLMLHGEAARVSDSKLTVSTTALGHFVALSYTWKFDGQDQEGTLLFGGGKEGTVGSWVDSWHNGDKIMALRGESAHNKVTLMGSYAAPPGPDWKWRIEISEDAGRIKMLMTNITPKGEEEPAVEVVYQRE